VQSSRATADENSTAARLEYDPNLRWRAGTTTHFFAAQFKDSLTHFAYLAGLNCRTS